MRRLGFVIASFASVSLAAAPLPAQTDGAGLAGEWVLVPSAGEGRARITRAFERALADNAVMRAVAMQRIDTDAMLARRIEVSITGDRVATTMHTTAAHRFRSRLRYPTQVTAENGRDAELTQVLRNGNLELVFDLDLGRRWTVLELVDADRMRLTTTIDPRMIDRNVRYVLDYGRAASN